MKYLLSAAVATLAMGACAYAAPMTIGGVNFDDSNGVVEAKLAAGDPTPVVGRPSPGADINEVEGFDLGTNFELRNNGTDPDDVLSLLFANPIVNGAGNCLASPSGGTSGPASAADYAGCDLLIFEVFNQSDSPTTSLTLAAATDPTQPNANSVLGVLLSFITNIDIDNDGDLDELTIWGFDLGLLGVPVGGAANNPLFVGRDQGTPDIAAIVGLNVVPIPAAAPLFIAGLAGLGFAARRRRRIT